MPTEVDIERVGRGVVKRYPQAVVELDPTPHEPTALTIRRKGRVFVVHLQPVWGICIDELGDDIQLFDYDYAHVERSAEAALDRVLSLMAS